MARTVLEQLKQQVLARPDDLSARRVYADALLEAGDPLGEFITLQCDLEGAAGSAREELERRATSLLDRYAAHWLQTLTLSDRAAVRFARGFVEHWSCEPGDFIARGTRVVARTPLRSLTLRHAHGRHLRHLAKMPAFASLETLSIEALSDWPFEALAEVPFSRLRALSLKGTMFNASHSLPAMCGAPWFARLAGLKLALGLPASDLLELSRHEGLTRVELSVSTTCADEEPLRALCTRARGLKELDVSRRPRFTMPARVLEALPPGLRALSLTGVELGDAELELLCQLPAPTITLGDFVVSDVGLARLRGALGERLRVGVRDDRPTLRERLARFRASFSR